ncbi:MAG: DUF6337 family protein [Bacteroidales bacterium]|nr:DUF6337 family protein [Bacteroidales bacterium]
MYIFFIICFSILFIELRFGKSLASPSSLVCISSIVGVLFAYIGGKFYAFYQISDSVYIIYSVCLFLFYIPSLFFLRYRQCKKKVLASKPFYKIDFMLFFIFLLLVILHLIASFRFGFLGSESFEKKYSMGVGAHGLNFLIVLSTFSLLYIRKKLLPLLFVLVSFLLIFVSGTKYHILFIISIVLLSFLYKKPTYNNIVKTAVLVCLLVFFMFAGNYFIGFILRGASMDNFMSFVVGHFAKYIGGGFIAMGRIIDSGDIVPHFLYSEIPNNFNEMILISRKIDEFTNVYTLFGSLLLSHGYFSLFFHIIIISVLSNIIFYSIKNKYSFLFYAFFIGSPLLMTFFNYYWHLENIWEWAFWAILLGFIKSKQTRFILCRYFKK